MPPQQTDRLPDAIDILLNFRAHDPGSMKPPGVRGAGMGRI
jgi:hypothetical protein